MRSSRNPGANLDSGPDISTLNGLLMMHLPPGWTRRKTLDQ
jgi:hypothetical protein